MPDFSAVCLVQAAVFSDSDPAARLTMLCPPSRMDDLVRNFKPVPIFLEHDTPGEPIGVLAEVWTKQMPHGTELMGRLVFNNETPLSRRVVAMARGDGVDLSLACDHEIVTDSAGREHVVRTHIREISVVRAPDVEGGCYVRTTASAEKINPPSFMAVNSVLIENSAQMASSVSNEPALDAAPVPAPPPQAAPSFSSLPADMRATLLDLNGRDRELIGQYSELHPDGKHPAVKLHASIRADPGKLDDPKTLSTYRTQMEALGYVVSAVKEIAEQNKRQREEESAERAAAKRHRAPTDGPRVASDMEAALRAKDASLTWNANVANKMAALQKADAMRAGVDMVDVPATREAFYRAMLDASAAVERKTIPKAEADRYFKDLLVNGVSFDAPFVASTVASAHADVELIGNRMYGDRAQAASRRW